VTCALVIEAKRKILAKLAQLLLFYHQNKSFPQIQKSVHSVIMAKLILVAALVASLFTVDAVDTLAVGLSCSVTVAAK
jgi:hypothetical protein